MKSFNAVYSKSKEITLNEQQNNVQSDHAKLISVIKNEYGINDFNVLSEAQKTSFRTMIQEMWNSETGLTEKGYAYLNEGKGRLYISKDSTDDEIKDYFVKKVGLNANKCIAALVSGEKCDIVFNIKKEIETKTGKPLKNCKKWLVELCGKRLVESINVIDFDAKDAYDVLKNYNR